MPPEATQPLVDPQGVIRDVPVSQVAASVAAKWRPPTSEDTARLSSEAASEQDYGGTAGAVKAAAYGVLRGATLGGSDVAFRLGGERAEDLRGLQAQNPGVSAGSELAGAILPSLIMPESLAARTPAGAVGGIGKAIARGAEDAGYGLGKRAIAATAGAAAEGALYGGGQYLSQVALEDKPLAAEGFLASMGKGALWAAPVGGALTLGEGALVRARSLFPRGEVTRQAARGVDREATSAIAQSVQDGDAMVAAARRRIAMSDAQVGQAAAGERVSRTMFGAAGPQAAADQIGAGLEGQKLTEAVDQYTQSRAALENWVRAEADPDLEAALLRVSAPDVQVGAPRLRRTDFGEVVPPQEVDFGVDPQRTSVGKLAKGTPVARGPDLPPLPVAEPPTGLPEISSVPSSTAPDSTRVGRRPAVAEGTPVGPIGSPTTIFRPEDLGLRFDPATRTYQEPLSLERSGRSGSPWNEGFGAHGTYNESPMAAAERAAQAEVIARRAGLGAPARGAYGSARPGGTFSNPQAAARRLAGEGRPVVLQDLERTLKEAGIDVDPMEAIRKGGAPGVNGIPTRGQIEGHLAEAGADFEEGILDARDIAKHGYYEPPGGHTDPVRVDKARKAIAEGQREPIELGIAPSGKIVLIGGRHRLAAAIEADAPIHVKWTTSYEPSEDLVHRGAAASKPQRFVIDHPHAGRTAMEISTETMPFGPGGKPRTHVTVTRRFADGETVPVGTAEFTHRDSGLYPEHVVIDQPWQRKGIGTRMYEAAEGSSGKKVIPSENQTPEGTAFSKKYRARTEDAARPMTGPAKAERIPGTTADRIEVKKVGNRRERKMEVTEYHSGVAGEPRVVSQDEAHELSKRSTPSGFTAHLLDARKDFTIASGIPASPAEIVDNAMYIVRPSELADRGTLLGNKIRPDDLKRGAEGLATTKLPTVEIDMAPNGEMFVVDGNHRIQNSATTDRPMAVRFRRVANTRSEEAAAGRITPDAGDPDINLTQRIRDALPRPEPSAGSSGDPSGGDLESLLRGTQDKLSAGESLNAIGAPARAEYSAAKSARTASAADHFRALARAEREAGPTDNPGLLSLFGLEGAEASLPHAAETAGMKGVLEEHGIGRGAAVTEVDHGMRARIAEHEAIGKTIVDRAMAPQMGRVVEEDAIAKALRKHAGKNVDIGANLSQAAKVIGDHEASSANLVDLLGAEAPPSAAANAKAYRAALAAQHDAASSSAAKAASDIASKVNPAAAGDATRVDSDIAKALRAHESASDSGAGRAVVSLQRKATREAAASGAGDAGSSAPASGGKLRGALRIAADVGTALEVLHAMGVHTPDIAAIPVIGPVLSLFLKARAVLGVIGRRGGSIGRSTEGVVAARAAAVRDRVGAAASAALDLGAKGARRAAQVAGPAGALAYRLFPGDGDTKSKNSRDLYQARADELARAQAPGAIESAVADRIRTSDPHLQDAITEQARRAITFLDSKRPGQGLLQSAVPGDGKWHPSSTAIEQFSKYVAAVHDPAGVLEDLANGHPSKEGAETLRAVYPNLFAQAQRALLQRASEIEHTLPYARRASISIMYRVPVDLSMSSQHMQFLRPPEQAAGAAPGGPTAPGPSSPTPQPALTAPLQLGQQTLTSLERRAGA